MLKWFVCRYRKAQKNIVQLDDMHVPKPMKGRGVSSALAREVLNHMAEKNVWMDVRCPITNHYIKTNPSANYVRQLVNPLKLERSKTAV